MARKKLVQWLSTKEVAALLGAAEVSVRKWCRTERFPNARREETARGAVWSIPATDLKDFAMRPPGPPQRDMVKRKSRG